jgi:hypothetical protein
MDRELSFIPRHGDTTLYFPGKFRDGLQETKYFLEGIKITIALFWIHLIITSKTGKN